MTNKDFINAIVESLVSRPDDWDARWSDDHLGTHLEHKTALIVVSARGGLRVPRRWLFFGTGRKRLRRAVNGWYARKLKP